MVMIFINVSSEPVSSPVYPVVVQLRAVRHAVESEYPNDFYTLPDDTHG